MFQSPNVLQTRPASWRPWRLPHRPHRSPSPWPLWTRPLLCGLGWHRLRQTKGVKGARTWMGLDPKVLGGVHQEKRWFHGLGFMVFA